MSPSPSEPPSSGATTSTRSTAGEALAEAVRVVLAATPVLDDVGITMLLRDGPVQGHATAFARGVDEVQHAMAEGPCVDATASGELVRVADLVHDERRWARFAPAAAGLGLRSAVSLPLHGHGRVVGALNLYSRAPQVLAGTEEVDLRRLADRVAPLVQNTWLLTVAVRNGALLRAAARRTVTSGGPSPA